MFKYSISKFLATAGGLLMLWAFSGCGIADAPENTPSTVQNVQQYYYDLHSTTAKYVYAIKDTSGNTTSTLIMKMHGSWNGSTVNGMSVYYCDWAWRTPSEMDDDTLFTSYYYAMNDSQAMYLGMTAAQNQLSSMELHGPLYLGAKWDYVDPQSGLSGKAEVTKFGVTGAMVNGKRYDDVMEVTCTTSAGKSVRWYAKGIGLIYAGKYSSGSSSEAGEWVLVEKD